MRVVALRPESGEHRQLACSRRQLADDNRVRQAAEHCRPETMAARPRPIEGESPVTRDFS
jgi:hypothetical protein